MRALRLKKLAEVTSYKKLIHTKRKKYLIEIEKGSSQRRKPFYIA